MKVLLAYHWGISDVSGKPIVIHGFEEFAFALHAHGKGRRVSELSTGFAVIMKDESSISPDEMHAITYAALILHCQGRKRLLDAIKKAKRTSNFPPVQQRRLDEQARALLAEINRLKACRRISG